MIEVDDKYVILFCEGYTKPIDVKLAEVKKNIIEDIREKKERLAMHEYYDRLQDMTTVDNYLEPSASHSPRRDAGLQPVAGSAVPTSSTTRLCQSDGDGISSRAPRWTEMRLRSPAMRRVPGFQPKLGLRSQIQHRFGSGCVRADSG